MLATLSFLTPLTAWALIAIITAIIVGFAILRCMGGPPAKVARRGSLVALRVAVVATLLLILLNPSDVSRAPGRIDKPDVFYLLDSSESMAIGDQETRFQHALRLMREADSATQNEPHADVKLFRFGYRLAAVNDSEVSETSSAKKSQGKTTQMASALPTQIGKASLSLTSRAVPDVTPVSISVGDGSRAKVQGLAPTDSDTQLLAALRQVSSRFGRRPPAGIVLFSDGRAHDETGVEQLAEEFERLKVPVHVVPLGDNTKGGDVAIVACVVPPHARRFSEVEVQVFLRSYGYEGQRCEVSLTTPADNADGVPQHLAPPVTVNLHDGFQSVGLKFRTESKSRKLQVAVSKMPNEFSTVNNKFTTEIPIDRTKIRVLYVEGSSQPLRAVQRGPKYEVTGAYSELRQALTEDEDIECVVLHSPYGRGRLSRVGEQGPTAGRGFPETVAELSAFDAIILSDVAADAFTDEQLAWIETWVGQRGGGLLMAGGQRSFSAGQWDETPLAQILPVELGSENDWIPGTQVSVRANPNELSHPLWTLLSDDRLNREVVERFPSFFGANRWDGAKSHLTRTLAMSNLAPAEAPASEPVATTKPTTVRPPSYFETLQKNLLGTKGVPKPQGSSPDTSSEKRNPSPNSAPATVTVPTTQPAIVVGEYGHGRTMAMCVPITSPWANDFLTKWGEEDSRYYGKFWRNTVYWLTEHSSIGRRRLVVKADKKFYRPGETILLSATAFDESANQTGSYKITSMVEPQGSLHEVESNYSPLRWPEGKARVSGETGPFIAWGEEFDLLRVENSLGKPGFSLELPIAEAQTGGAANRSLRIEMTALEDVTQIDSTTLDIQVLHDPFEQQNPFPNHELLNSIAAHSGGKVLQDGESLAEVLRKVPMKVGPPIVKRTPLWSNWWLWFWILGLLSVEWVWRRVVGLA